MITPIEQVEQIKNEIEHKFDMIIHIQTRNIGGADFVMISEKAVWVQHQLSRIYGYRVTRLNDKVYAFR